MYISRVKLTNEILSGIRIVKFYAWENAFDGMIETIIADYKYIPQARTISVDSRYLLWTLEKLEKADNILDELTIVK